MKVPRPSKLEETYYAEFVAGGAFAQIAEEFVEEDPEVIKQAVLKTALYKVYKAQVAVDLYREPERVVLLVPLILFTIVAFNLFENVYRNSEDLFGFLVGLVILSPLIYIFAAPVWEERRRCIDMRKRKLEEKLERGHIELRQFLQEFEKEPGSLRVWGICRK